ncbi:hypothetical protein F4782DRAFT_544822 [Xylaria castorea]|nr:hypothetical protein F4782DRAFT_544822 [Xylaria castorea]
MNKKRADSKGDDVLDTASEIQRELAKLNGGAKVFTNSLNKLHALLADLTSEKKELEVKLKSAQQQVVQLTEDLEQISGEQHSAPDLDNVLESQFMDLREQVRSLTLNLCASPVLSSSIHSNLPEYVKVALARISGISTTQLLKSGLHARYFVQALIWRLLCDILLANPFSIWGAGGEVGEIVRKFQNSPKLPIKRRQLWRRQTGRILVDISNPRPARLQYWRKKLADHIRPLVKAEHEDDVAKHVEPILDQAIGLAKNLAQSRTMCFIQRKGIDADDTISQKYDDRWMEVVEKALVSYEDIDFLVTPALVQITNSAGEAFEHPRVIVKAEVCYGRGRLPVSAAPTSDSPTQGRATETASGRQSRKIVRLGEAANDDEVNEQLGEDVEEGPDYVSDDYKDDSS